MTLWRQIPLPLALAKRMVAEPLKLSLVPMLFIAPMVLWSGKSSHMKLATLSALCMIAILKLVPPQTPECDRSAVHWMPTPAMPTNGTL
jgi:hypothetical protein